MSKIGHLHSYLNKEEIESSKKCGCYCCCKIFDVDNVKYWCDDNKTALCPYCGVDAVIGDASKLPLTKDYLVDMHQKWFNV